MRRRILFVCLAVVVSRAGAASQYREFTSADGKIILGCVKAYDARTQTVTIERDNRRSSTAPVSAFSAADQAYILEWDAAKGFLSDSLLRISCVKKRGEQRKDEKWDDVRIEGGGTERMLLKETFFDSQTFDLQFYNTGKSPLADLRLEYIVYYEQSKESWEKPVVEQMHFKEGAPIPAVEAGGKVEVSTKPVEVYRESINSLSWTSGRSRTGGEGEIHGMRARIYMKMPSGSEVMRELTFPDKLSEEKFPWKG